MKEATFIKQNKETWESYEQMLNNIQSQSPDELAEIYVNITNDLAFARTHYPNSQLTAYLNQLAANFHQFIYRNKKEKRSRFITFWTQELPTVMASTRKELLYSFLIMLVGVLIGIVSMANDEGYIRLIMGDAYVNMTLENIKNDDPMAVYKKAEEMSMFLGITFNNVIVSFRVFAFGVLTAFGAGLMLFYNGVMLGAFQYFFFEKGLFFDSFLTIWIHGTLEISAIVIAGSAGIVLGNSWLFPGTYPRKHSVIKGAKKGLKIVIGLVPIFITAGFLEGFVTRHTEMPAIAKVLIIALSAFFIIYYFIIFPSKIKRHANKPKN